MNGVGIAIVVIASLVGVGVISFASFKLGMVVAYRNIALQQAKKVEDLKKKLDDIKVKENERVLKLQRKEKELLKREKELLNNEISSKKAK